MKASEFEERLSDRKVSKLVECFVRDKPFYHSLETAYLGDVPELKMSVSKEAFEGSAVSAEEWGELLGVLSEKTTKGELARTA